MRGTKKASAVYTLELDDAEMNAIIVALNLDDQKYEQIVKSHDGPILDLDGREHLRRELLKKRDE